jgi:SagB-type dehydrogenase family enzyme
MINLPEPKLVGKVSIEEVILKRRSTRSFTAKTLSMEEISQLLWSAQGITDKMNKFRSAPSAGARYPMEIYLATNEGFYHYHPSKNAIEQLKSTDIRSKLPAAALGQKYLADAPLVIIIAGKLEKLSARYGDRASRYMFIEAGHIAQNIHLQAVSLGLGSVPVCAFNDDVLKTTADLPDDLKPLYIVPVGYAK